MAKFEVLFRHLSGRTVENLRDPFLILGALTYLVALIFLNIDKPNNSLRKEYNGFNLEIELYKLVIKDTIGRHMILFCEAP